MKVFPICLNSLVPNLLTWKSNLDGIYTARDGSYWLIKLELVQNTTCNNSWKWVRHIHAPEKVKLFVWTTLHIPLSTISMLHHYSMLETSLCSRWNQDAEMSLHCLR